VFEVIIVTHGNLAQAFYETAQLIVGEREHVRTFGLNLGDSVDLFAEEVAAAIAISLLKGDVLVLTDMQAGSPCNVTTAAMIDHKFRHITGINLPMVIEVLSSQEFMDIEETCEAILEIGREAVRDINKLVEGVQAEFNKEGE